MRETTNIKAFEIKSIKTTMGHIKFSNTKIAELEGVTYLLGGCWFRNHLLKSYEVYNLFLYKH